MPTHKPEKLNFKLAGGNIAALAWGEKSSYPILALHGWLDNANSFAPIAPWLAQHNFRLIAIDFPGHGFSDHKPKGTYMYFSDYVADVAILIDQILEQTNRPQIALLGHSLGGAVASLVASVTKNKISHLMLIDAIGPLAAKADHAAELMEQSIAQYKRIDNKSLPKYATIDEAIQARLRATPMTEPAVRILLDRGLKHSRPSAILAKTSPAKLISSIFNECLTSVLHRIHRYNINCYKYFPMVFSWRTDPRLLLKPLCMFVEPQVENFLRQIIAPSCLILPAAGWPFSHELLTSRCKHVHDLTIYNISGHHHVHMDSPEEVATLLCTFIKSRS